MKRVRGALVGPRSFALLAILWSAVLAGESRPIQATPGPSQRSPGDSSSQRALLDKYCVTCHNQRSRVAGLVLDGADLGDVAAAAPVWEKVIQKLRSGAMPPPGLPRPDTATSVGLASWLEGELDRHAEARPNPGRPSVHRLNRTEYANAVRDLLAVEIDSRAMLPADDAGYGFDNNADALALSPGLLDRYMSAARKISRLAVGDPTIRPFAETYQVSSQLAQDDRMSDDLPFGSRGGVAIRHRFPLDGEYLLKVRLQRTPASGAIRGLSTEPQQLDVRLDGARVKAFAVGGQSKTAKPPPADEFLYQTEDADAGLEVRFPAKAGTRVVGVSLLKGPNAIEGTGPTRLPVWTFSAGRAVETMGIDSVLIEGPHNPTGSGDTASRAKIFQCRPARAQDEEPCARRILSAIARRAYRRPVTDQDVDTLRGFYRTSRLAGGFDAGIQAALEGILVDPEFLFRIERDPASIPPAAVYRLSDLELASRLSFFLWSTIPDDELLDVAESGKLKSPAVLEQQVRRMLSDQRSNALVTNFAAQWLHLRNMQAVTPDVLVFPEFDDNLRDAFVQETELFVDSQLREDQSVSELLTANYTFVNERLARHYGIPNVAGSRFRRVTLPDDKRAGLLGQGSILTVTSYSTRTSPVIRGKWVLDNLLGAPPPPPPPDVPALPDSGEGGKPASVRERLERHRSNPVCAACHSRMDPIGFALENFDGIGKWRDTGEGNARIDPSGVMPDGTRVAGPAELRALLRDRRDEFVLTVATKLLTYALGRGVEPSDMPALRRIVRTSAANDYRWSSIMLEIVKSIPFAMRRAES